MRRIVGDALRKNDGLECIWFERVNRGWVKCGKRNLKLNPCLCGKVSAEGGKIEFRGELSTCVDETHTRECGGGKTLWRVTPNIKIRAIEMNGTTSKSDDIDLGSPTAVGNRSPGKTQSGGRRERNSRFNGELLVFEFERAGRCGVAVTVEIVVARQAVVENDVLVVATIGENWTWK